MNPPLTFDELLAQLQDIQAQIQRLNASDSPIRQAYDKELLSVAEGKQTGKRRKKFTAETAWASLGEEERLAIRSKYASMEQQAYDVLAEAKKVTQSALREAARPLSFSEPRTQWLRCHTVHRSTYSTQPADVFYMEGAAELRAVEAQMVGLETRLVREHYDFPDNTPGLRKRRPTDPYDQIHVEVLVAGQRDVELLNYKPGLSMREWMKACWKRAINPRVLIPGLPHGLEEKWGIDYQGNDVKKPEHTV